MNLSVQCGALLPDATMLGGWSWRALTKTMAMAKFEYLAAIHGPRIHDVMGAII